MCLGWMGQNGTKRKWGMSSVGEGRNQSRQTCCFSSSIDREGSETMGDVTWGMGRHFLVYGSHGYVQSATGKEREDRWNNCRRRMTGGWKRGKGCFSSARKRRKT